MLSGCFIMMFLLQSAKEKKKKKKAQTCLSRCKWFQHPVDRVNRDTLPQSLWGQVHEQQEDERPPAGARQVAPQRKNGE